MTSDKLNIIYIAGNGHSGSTLLDIILGSDEMCFSAGELVFISRDSILNEYCSCGLLIPNCTIWSKVLSIWKNEINMTIADYKGLTRKFERNRTTFRTLYNKIHQTKEFDKYCLATKKLFETIQMVTGKEIIIDSSKSPQRILVLQNISNLKVIHLCRDFSGILNSRKNTSQKDITAGIEEDSPAGKTWKVLTDWLAVNILTIIFSIGVSKIKIKYRNYIVNPKIVFEKIKLKVDYNRVTNNKYYPEHLLAGNIIRLKNEIIIDPSIGRSHYRLIKDRKYLEKLSILYFISGHN